MAKLVTAIIAIALLLVAFLATSASATLVGSNTKPRKMTLSKFVNKTVEGLEMPPAKVGNSYSGSGSGSGSSGASYSYLIFALQKCEDSSPFTIHGLWPSTSPNNGPENCGGSFDPSAIASLSSQISRDWPSCSWSHSTENEFLSHEWTKHGTCTGWTELQYFQETLSLYQQGEWKQYCDNGQNTCKVQVNLH